MNETRETPDRPWFAFGCAGAMTPTDIRNIRRFDLWMIAWAIAWVTALFALRSDWLRAPSARVVLVAMPVGFALATILAYLRFLRHADELLRKIHLEGMACGFGVAFVLLSSTPLLERAGLPPVEGSVQWAAMVCGWGVGQIFGRRRYA
jgi:hypothetical protein